jgi:predicted nuclease with TOPRIM domain
MLTEDVGLQQPRMMIPQLPEIGELEQEYCEMKSMLNHKRERLVSALTGQPQLQELRKEVEDLRGKLRCEIEKRKRLLDECDTTLRYQITADHVSEIQPHFHILCELQSALEAKYSPKVLKRSFDQPDVHQFIHNNTPGPSSET